MTMAAVLILLLIAVMILYGRSVSTTLVKSVREAGIYFLVLLSLIALTVLFFSTYTNP